MDLSPAVWPFGQANWDLLAASLAVESVPEYQAQYGPVPMEEPMSPEDEEVLF